MWFTSLHYSNTPFKNRMIRTKICIIGAGPGGAAAALKLDRLGIPCVVVDKAVFPRDKICGDAISGKVVYGLNRIDKSLAQEFHNERAIRAECWGLKLLSFLLF